MRSSLPGQETISLGQNSDAGDDGALTATAANTASMTNADGHSQVDAALASVLGVVLQPQLRSFSASSSDNPALSEPVSFSSPSSSSSVTAAATSNAAAAVFGSQHQLIQRTAVPHKHQCSFEGCGKSFKEKKVLRKHTLTHQPRRFHCEIPECGKAFYERAKLKRHQLVHSGEKSFLCTFEGCDKRFALKANLLTHARIHTGMRPYQCPFPGCYKRFSQTSGRNSHYKIHLKSIQSNNRSQDPTTSGAASNSSVGGELKRTASKSMDNISDVDSQQQVMINHDEGPDHNTKILQASLAKRPRAVSTGILDQAYTAGVMRALVSNANTGPIAVNELQGGVNLLQLLATTSMPSSATATHATTSNATSPVLQSLPTYPAPPASPMQPTTDSNKLDTSLWLNVLGRLPTCSGGDSGSGNFAGGDNGAGDSGMPPDDVQTSREQLLRFWTGE